MRSPKRLFGSVIKRMAEMMQGMYEKAEIHARAFYVARVYLEFCDVIKRRIDAYGVTMQNQQRDGHANHHPSS
jgi:hypothetical protein